MSYFKFKNHKLRNMIKSKINNFNENEIDKKKIRNKLNF